MTRDTCRLPGCKAPPGMIDSDTSYRSRSFCSPQCETRYDHLVTDARDTRRQDGPKGRAD